MELHVNLFSEKYELVIIHTEPETWYYIETKNELHELRKEKEKMKKYEKFDYMNFVPAK